jgi:hypothetical protein
MRGITLEPAGFTYAEEFMDPAAEDDSGRTRTAGQPRRDDARTSWQHRIAATKDDRYSLTLRSLTAAQ